MPRLQARDLAHRLGRQAEAVCRHYLSAGRRQGNYWQVGDARNTPGRSMYVRLTDSSKGPAGKWTDAAVPGEHGDLLDVIRESCGLVDFADVVEEARHFLSLPYRETEAGRRACRLASAPPASAQASRRLFTMAQPITGTLAETYLRSRGITSLRGAGTLRFHPRCYYRPDEHSPTEVWPALVAAVTDLDGRITGAHRTWLAPDGTGKAPISTQRKAMGDLLGHGVRFGTAGDVLAAGEGIETVLSARTTLPDMPMLAALSAGHLAAILFPLSLRRLYVIRDRDPAGHGACDCLIDKASGVGIEAIGLSPARGDFNEDLCTTGAEALRQALRDQLRLEDIVRFMAR
ncbi:toprim domain-containing protein [Labrys sp. KB_33_2]|uniref:DUF7146 domain-containing protein n=1 Tax=Labrys sp. KB_33_2 TaxID=3237479 RepID=UPI003F8DA937